MPLDVIIRLKPQTRHLTLARKARYQVETCSDKIHIQPSSTFCYLAYSKTYTRVRLKGRAINHLSIRQTLLRAIDDPLPGCNPQL